MQDETIDLRGSVPSLTFTDAQRADPPPVGSWVTYRFRGLHEGSGLPRFASFLRVRSDEARFRSAPR